MASAGDSNRARDADHMLARIGAIRAELRRSEQSVADFILAQPNTVINMSIAEIAQTIGVSQPTVARFCHALNLTGFKAFKLRLAQSLAGGEPFTQRGVSSDDSVAEISRKVFDHSIAALIGVRNRLDSAALERAVAILAAAGRIEFYGIGNSGIVALDGQHKFFRLNIPVVAYSDPHVHGIAATLLHPGDAVVAISSGGRTLDLLRSVELARAAGAEVVGITKPGSLLAQRCSVTLGVDVAEVADIYAPSSSRLAHLAIIDVLAAGVAVARGPELVARLKKTRQTLRSKRVRGFD